MQIDEIEKKMALEKGYIIGKAFDVLSEMSENNYQFTEVNAEMDDNGAILNDTGEIIVSFINETCEMNPLSKAFSDDLFLSYISWCNTHKIASLPKISFCQRFSALYPKLEKKHSSRGGKTANYYIGIKLREVDSND
ncbi:MAG: primase-like DNA-binding domain-containing protein [Eubacteriales bacterium]